MIDSLIGGATPFSIMDMLEPERPRSATFVNLDAKFLHDLAVEMEDGEAPDETTVRLRQIARNLEHLDERNRNLMSANPDYASGFAAGIVEGKRRYLARSNLPIQSVEINDSAALREAVARTTVRPRRVATGKPPVVKKVNPLSVEGIVLDLSILDKE